MKDSNNNISILDLLFGSKNKEDDYHFEDEKLYMI
jgi:hypothetical protein